MSLTIRPPLTYLPSKQLISEENIKFYHQFLKQNHIDIVVDQGGNFDEHPLWLNVGDSHAKKYQSYTLMIP